MRAASPPRQMERENEMIVISRLPFYWGGLGVKWIHKVSMGAAERISYMVPSVTCSDSDGVPSPFGRELSVCVNF